jgi:hypothetical protein
MAMWTPGTKARPVRVELDDVASITMPERMQFAGRLHWAEEAGKKRVYRFVGGRYRQGFSGVMMDPVTLDVALYGRGGPLGEVDWEVVNTPADGRYPQKRRLVVADSVRRVSVEFTAPEKLYSRDVARKVAGEALASVVGKAGLGAALEVSRNMAVALDELVARRRAELVDLLRAEGIRTIPLDGVVFGRSVAVASWAGGKTVQLIRVVEAGPGRQLLRWKAGRWELDGRGELSGLWQELAGRLTDRTQEYHCAAKTFELRGAVDWAGWWQSVGRAGKVDLSRNN